MEEVKKNEKTNSKRFEFRISNDDLELIKSIAESHGLTTSNYIKVVSLGYKPISIIEKDKIDQLLKVNSDMARLGNLLKAWIFNDSKYQVATRMKIESKLGEILDGIDSNRKEISTLVSDMRSVLLNEYNK